MVSGCHGNNKEQGNSSSLHFISKNMGVFDTNISVAIDPRIYCISGCLLLGFVSVNTRPALLLSRVKKHGWWQQVPLDPPHSDPWHARPMSRVAAFGESFLPAATVGSRGRVLSSATSLARAVTFAQLLIPASTSPVTATLACTIASQLCCPRQRARRPLLLLPCRQGLAAVPLSHTSCSTNQKYRCTREYHLTKISNINH